MGRFQWECDELHADVQKKHKKNLSKEDSTLFPKGVPRNGLHEGETAEC